MAGALLATTALVSVPADHAEADDGAIIQPGIEISGVLDKGPSWLGAMVAPNGVADVLYFCIQAGYPGPVGHDPAGVDLVDDPQLAYIYAAHRATEDATTRAAISYLTHMRHERDSAMPAEMRKARIDTNTPQSVKDQAASFLAEAGAKAGPYAAPETSVDTADRRKGSIHGLGVHSSSGAWLPGQNLTVTLSGPAVFDATGTPTWTGTTTSSPISLDWTATGSGEVTYAMEVGGLPRVTLTRFSMDGQIQDGLSYDRRPSHDPEEITRQGAPFDVVMDFQPEIRTQVATTFVDKGQALVDQVTVAAAAGDTWAQVNGAYVPVKAEGVLYGPYASQPAQSAAVPAGAPVAGTASLTFDGPGTLDASASTLAQGSGYYTWVWTISKAAQGDFAQYIRGDAAHDFGMVVETHIVPFQPVVTTVVEDRAVEVGGAFVDEVTFGTSAGDLWLTRQDGSPVETVWDGTLYGPFPEPTAQVAATPSGAPVAARTTLRASEPGVQRTDAAAKATAPGFYTWVWEMDRAKQPVATQPYLAGSFRDAFMIEAETSTVRHTASLTSLVREFNVVQGGQIHDTITVSGIPDYYGNFPGLGGWVADVGQIEHTAYGPLRTQPTDSLDLTTAPVLGVATTPAKNGEYLIGMDGEFQIAADNSAAGWYVIVSSFPGDDRLNAFQTSPGDKMEMAFVPYDQTEGDVDTWLVTDADEQVAAGQPFKDTAYLTGTIHEGGYLEFEAYGPFTEDVEPVESPETLLWTSARIPVFDAGTFRSGYTTADLPEGAEWGDVFWVATYYDGDGEQVVRGAFGDPSEITRLVAPETPVVTTLAQPMVALGDPAHDVAYVSGPVEPGSTLTFAAYRQVDPEPDEGEGVEEEPAALGAQLRTGVPGAGDQDDQGPAGEVDVSGDVLVFDTAEDPLVIYHGGTYTSAEVVFEEVGTYYWVETLYGPDGDVVHVGAPRLPNETTQVIEITTEAVKEIVAGDSAHDVAFIEGITRPGSTLGFEVFRQDAGDDVAKDELVATLDPVEVTGDEITSGEVVLTEVGTYYWVETLYGPRGDVVHVGAPRLPNETTNVVAAAQDVAVAAAQDSPAAVDEDRAQALATTGLRAGLVWVALTLLAVGAGLLGRARAARTSPAVASGIHLT